MPIYEFECKGCASRFDELVSAGKEQAVACPSCGSTKTERRYSSFATKWKPKNVKWHRLAGRKYKRPRAAPGAYTEAKDPPPNLKTDLKTEK